VIVVDAADAPLREGESALAMERLPRVDAFPVAHTTAETPSVLHYTSGTTGQPKGAQHVHHSLISQYLTAKQVLDLRDDDVYWCNADPGWVTGTSYGIIGPWSNGVTQVVLDAGFNSERWYAFMQKHKVTVWYSAPTAIRLLMREGTGAVRRHDLSSLRHLASVGEPLNPERDLVAGGVRAAVPRHLLADRDGLHRHHQPARDGDQAGLDGQAVSRRRGHGTRSRTLEPIARPGSVGLIALRPGWPSLIRSYWNNPVAYASKFRSGWYLTGDRASVDADGTSGSSAATTT